MLGPLNSCSYSSAVPDINFNDDDLDLVEDDILRNHVSNPIAVFLLGKRITLELPRLIETIQSLQPDCKIPSKLDQIMLYN